MGEDGECTCELIDCDPEETLVCDALTEPECQCVAIVCEDLEELDCDTDPE